MRKVLVFLATCMFIATGAYAQPFLTCDAPPVGDTVEFYEVEYGGVTYNTPAPLLYDVGALPNGRTDFLVRACADVTYTGDGGEVISEKLCSPNTPYGVIVTGKGVKTAPGNPKVE